MLVKLAIDIYSQQPLDEAERSAIENHTQRVMEELDANCTIELTFSYYDELEPRLAQLAGSIFGEANITDDLVMLTVAPAGRFLPSMPAALWLSRKLEELAPIIGRKVLIGVRSRAARSARENLLSLN